MKTSFSGTRIFALLGLAMLIGGTAPAATYFITSSTTYTAKVTANVEYVLSDDVTVTFATPNSPTQTGGVFNSSNAANHFIVRPLNPGGSGRVVFSGSGTPEEPSAGVPATAQHGGAFFARSCSVSLTNATLTNYWTSGNAGGIYAGTNAGATTKTAVLLTNVVFSNNGAFHQGGAMFLGTGAVATLQNVVFASNRADGFAARGATSNTSGVGGAIMIQGETANLAVLSGVDVIFSNNTAMGAQGRGGAIYGRTAQTYLKDPVFTGNVAGAYGGAIAIDTGHVLTIDVTKDVAYTGNSAYGITTGSVQPTSTLAPNQGGFLNIANFNTVANINIASGKTLVIGSAANVLADTLAASGSATLNVNMGASGSLAAGTSNGALVLNGTSATFSGFINVGAGALLLGNNSAAQAGWITVRSGATFGGAGSVVGNSSVTGTGGATITVGTENGGLLTFGRSTSTVATNTNGLILTGANTLTGSGTLGGAILIGGPLTANITDTAQPLVVIATLTGTNAGAITKTGAGTLAFASNNNNFKAPVTVNAGSLRIDATGTLGSNVTISNGGALAISAASGAPSITGTLALANGGAIHYDNGANPVALKVGALTAAGGNTVAITKLASGTFTLINSTATITDPVASAFATAYKDMPLTGRTSAAYSGQGANTLQLTLTVTSATRSWTGAQNGNWNSTGTNWAEAEKLYQDGDAVVFGGSGAAAPIVIGDAGVIVSDMLVSNASGTHTFAGEAITADAASWQNGAGGAAATPAKLTKTGAGSLAFTNTANNFQGGIDISGGAISFTSGAQLGTRNAASVDQGITFSGNSALIAAADGIAFDNAILIGAGVTATIDTRDNTLAYSGALSAPGAGAILRKSGSGTLNLASDNTAFAGATAIAEGTLYLASAGKLGGNIAIASGATLAGTGTATGNVSAGTGARIRVGDTDNAATPQKLSITGTLDLNNATLALKTNSSGNDTINAGKVTVSGTNIVDFYDMPGVSGTYTLIKTAAGITGVTGGNFVIYNEGQEFTRLGRVDITFAAPANDLLLTLLYHNGGLVWAGDKDNIWRSNHENWSGADTYFLGGDSVTFNGIADAAHSANRTITVSDNGVYVASMNVTGAASYTFIGGAIHSTDATTFTGADANQRLNMDGAGLVTLLNDTANTFAGGIAINTGTVAGNTVSLGTNAVTVAAPGSLIISQTVAGDYAGSATGQGVVIKQGAASLGLAATGTIASKTFNVNEGSFDMAAGALRGNTVNVNDGAAFTYNGGVINVTEFNLARGAVFSSTGASLTLAAATFRHAGELRVGVAATGTTASIANPRRTFTIAGNYAGQGGTLVLSTDLVTFDTDRLNINGDASGNAFVNILHTGTIAGSPTTGKGIQIVGITGGDTLDLQLAGRVIAGPYDYLLYHDAGGIFLRSVISREVTAANAAPAVAMLAGRASLDTLQNRLGEIRLDPKKHAGLWLRDTFRRDTLQKGWLSDIDVDTNVAQVGFDRAYINPNNTPHNFIVGAYYARTDSRAKMPDATSSIDMSADGGGAYLIYKRDQFYIEALVRGDWFKDTVTAPYSRQTMKGTIFGGSIEAGYEIPLTPKLGTLEVQAQVLLDYIQIKSSYDNQRRLYTFESLPGPSARGGLRWHNDYRINGLGVFIPWIRGSWAYDAKAEYSTTVAYSLAPIGVMNQTQTFADSMRGQRFIFDAGLTWQIAEHWALYASGLYETAPRSVSWAGTGGVRYSW